MSCKRIRGFTLVEVLIVVVIMAVLAAVVIPQFSASTDDAKRSAGEFNLSTLRSIVQIYKAQHNANLPVTISGTPPTLSQLLKNTNSSGTEGTGAYFPYGPYLVEFPDNPYTNKKDVVVTTLTVLTGPVTASNAGGWAYNVTTGQIFLDSSPGFDF